MCGWRDPAGEGAAGRGPLLRALPAKPTETLVPSRSPCWSYGEHANTGTPLMWFHPSYPSPKAHLHLVEQAENNAISSSISNLDF